MSSARQLPRWSDVAPILRPKPFEPNSSERRLSKAANVEDLRRIARKRVPKAVFDYVDGAAGDEISRERSTAAYRRVEFRPGLLNDVSSVHLGRAILGEPSALPIVLAPTGFTRMMHHAGEAAVARVAGRHEVPYALSTMGTTSLEDVAAAAPDTRRWFQLYLWRDRAATADMVRRAALAGYEALVLTIDTPVAGSRLRDVRNGMTVPPSLTLRTFADGARRPWWWLNLLTTRPLEFASIRSSGGTLGDLVNRIFDPSITMNDVLWLRDTWKGKLIVKGIQTAESAAAMFGAGADAVVVSNHGGRQLDRSVVPLEELPSIAQAVRGRGEVYVDGGVMSGADVIAAICFGADAVLIGRAYLYGLMAAGELGVERALQMLASEAKQTMQLLGVTSIQDLRPGHVRLRQFP
jgi:L-lactate dehydrogenase (cytochrome)